jgi:ubiquinone/menaquinone biosynthesis C-methylase UbiE
VLDYDREAAHYDTTRGGDARASAAAEAIEVLLRQAGGSGAARIIDLACGTGIVTVRLARPGRSVTGIDRSAGMAAVAAGRLPGRIALGDVTRLPLAAGSADAVTMVWLLHLLSAPACVQAVAEAARVLRPGGLLITTAGKNDAEFAPPAGDATAILAPVRARFGRAQTDAMDRVRAVGGQHGLTPAAQTTFAGIGQGLSPRDWRKRLDEGAMGWMAAAGPDVVGTLRAELAGLPDQDLARPDPIYQLIALRKGWQ